MNEREKIIAAIVDLQTSAERIIEAAKATKQAEADALAAEKRVCHALHAVFGKRASEGVLYRGIKYAVVTLTDGKQVLKTDKIDCEVLG